MTAPASRPSPPRPAAGTPTASGPASSASTRWSARSRVSAAAPAVTGSDMSSEKACASRAADPGGPQGGEGSAGARDAGRERSDLRERRDCGLARADRAVLRPPVRQRQRDPRAGEQRRELARSPEPLLHRVRREQPGERGRAGGRGGEQDRARRWAGPQQRQADARRTSRRAGRRRTWCGAPAAPSRAAAVPRSGAPSWRPGRPR